LADRTITYQTNGISSLMVSLSDDGSGLIAVL